MPRVRGLSIRAGTGWEPLFDAVEKMEERRERIIRAGLFPLRLRPLALVGVLLGRGLLIVVGVAVSPALLSGVLRLILTANRRAAT